jgi:hypothetical protein
VQCSMLHTSKDSVRWRLICQRVGVAAGSALMASLISRRPLRGANAVESGCAARLFVLVAL